ncbi:hypothetical protein A9W99_11205 [Mycobacterium sp. 1164966.3]|uniref:nuclear transport factor 2 family protein n=1 Tax=Mycobacterium sp. 1164966.3 TaxID=1856861 RepID=UPI000801B1B6|nr:nuclear transport factor 2 family protein [Mycobacterium sp. 1164966.3]OBA82671.1 hypothetical protein A9W99_11205 [Mycobacterium sp. 1164966.3]
MVESAESAVRNFHAAWVRWDVDELIGFFTEDAVWTDGHNEPLKGVDAIRAQLQVVAALVPSTTADINGLLASGSTVMVERVDIFEFKDEAFVIEAAAVFEVDGNGRIARWRDYYDSRGLQDRILALLAA